MGIARVKQENQQPFSIYLLPSAAFLWNAEASSSTIAKQNRYSQMNMKPPMEVVAGVEAPLVSLPRSASALLQGLGKSQLAQDPPPNMGVLCCPSFLSCALSICCPFSWLGSCRIVNEKEGALLLTFGKFTTVIKQPGCYFLNPCGTTLTKVSTKQQTTDLPNVKLLDLKGNPVVVSGVVFWQIEGIKASVLNVENVYRYVNTTAMATLKQVVSKYPYEEDHDHVFGSPSGATSSKPGLSLKTEAAQVARELKDVLQDRLAHAGVSVIAFNMTDLSYAPEIAQAMLVRQQAEAMVKARKLIVKGAVDISEDAVDQLQARGVSMTEPEKTKIVTNLLTVISGESGAQPVVQLQ